MRLLTSILGFIDDSWGFSFSVFFSACFEVQFEVNGGDLDVIYRVGFFIVVHFDLFGKKMKVAPGS